MKVSGLLIITENSQIDIKKIKGTIIVMMVDARFHADKDFWEDWWSVLAHSLVAVESDT